MSKNPISLLGTRCPRTRGIAEGAYFVEKPIRPERLLELIRALLRDG